MDSAFRGNGSDRGDYGERRGDDGLEPLVLALVPRAAGSVAGAGSSAMTEAVRAYCALYELEEGELRYVQPKALALWQQRAACDVCLRYMIYGHIGENNIEASMFCASSRCPDCGPDCETSEQTGERIAAWHAWVREQQEQRERHDAEGRMIREQRELENNAFRRAVRVHGYGSRQASRRYGRG